MTKAIKYAILVSMENMIDEIHYKSQNIASNILQPHFHNGYEILFVTEGYAEVEINYYPHFVKAPAIILLNPFEWHRIIRADEYYKRYSLVLNTRCFEQSIHTHLVTFVKCRPAGFSHVIPLTSNAQNAIKIIFDILISENQNDNPYKEQLIANEIYNLIILLYRMKGVKQIVYDERMIKIQQYIDANYQIIENVNELSCHFFLSREHFTRAFKKFSGYSPVEYLLHTRLYHAQLLLLNTEKNLAEICVDIGFRDTNNFIRQFRKKYGLPPATFRKANKINK